LQTILRKGHLSSVKNFGSISEDLHHSWKVNDQAIVQEALYNKGMLPTLHVIKKVGKYSVSQIVDTIRVPMKSGQSME